MNTKYRYFFLVLASSFILFACSKKNNNNETVTSQDRTFMMNASLSNNAEVQAAQLADTTTGSSGIKAFAEKMISDHTTAQNDLKALASSLNVPVTDSVDPMHMALMDSLKMLNGSAFDSVYILRQISDHQNAISTFQQEVNEGNRSEVVDYANKYLPKLKMHLQMADSIASAMHFK